MSVFVLIRNSTLPSSQDKFKPTHVEPYVKINKIYFFISQKIELFEDKLCMNNQVSYTGSCEP